MSSSSSSNNSREQNHNINDVAQFHSNLSQQKRFYLQSCLNDDITPHVAVIQLFHKAEQNMEAYIDMDLSNQAINDTDVLPLIKMLSKDKWVLSLNLSDNLLEQAACFFDLISDNNALQALFLNKNYFSPNHLEKLNRFALSANKSIFIEVADQRKVQQHKTIISPAKTTLLREQILEKISSTKNQKIKRSQDNICVTPFNQQNYPNNSGFLIDQVGVQPPNIQQTAPLSTQNVHIKQHSMISEKNSQSAQISKLMHYLDLKKTIQHKRFITDNTREQDKSHSPSSQDKYSLISSFSNNLSKNNQSISLSTCNQQQNCSILSSYKTQEYVQQPQINYSNKDILDHFKLNQQGKQLQQQQKLINNFPENKNNRNQLFNPGEITHSLSSEASPHSQSDYYPQHNRITSIPQQLFQQSNNNGNTSTFDDGLLESFRKQNVLQNKGKISGSQTYRERTAAESNKNQEPKLMMSRMDWLLQIRRIFDTMENEGFVSKQQLISEIIANRKQFRQMSQEEYTQVKKGEQGMTMEELLSQIAKITENYLSIDQLFNLIGSSSNPATSKNKSVANTSTINNNRPINKNYDKQNIDHELSAVFDPSLFKKKYFPSTSTPRINRGKVSQPQSQNQANNQANQQKPNMIIPQLNISEIMNDKESQENFKSSKTQSTSLINSARQKYDKIEELTSFQSPQTTKNAKNSGFIGSEGGHEFKSNISTTASKGQDSCDSNKRISDRSASLNMEISSPSRFHFTSNPHHYQSNSLISTPQQTKNNDNLAELNYNNTQQQKQQSKIKKNVQITPLNSSICENNSSSNTTAKFFKKDSLSSLSNGPASTKAAQEKISPLRQQLRQLGLSGSPFAVAGESNFKKFCLQASPAGSLFQFKGQGSSSPAKGQMGEGKDGIFQQKFGNYLINDKVITQPFSKDKDISKLATNFQPQKDQNEQISISPSSQSKKGKKNDLSAFSFSESSCAVLQQGYEDNCEKYSNNNIRKKLIPYEEGFTIDKHSEELEESLTDFIARQGLNQQDNSVKNNESNQQVFSEKSQNNIEKPNKSNGVDSKNNQNNLKDLNANEMKGKKLSYEPQECKQKKQQHNNPEYLELESKITRFEVKEENEKMSQNYPIEDDSIWLQARQDTGDVSKSGGFFGCDSSLEDIDELKQIVETIQEQINQNQYQEQNEKILKIIQQASQYTRINMDDTQLQQQPSMQQYSGHSYQEQLYGVKFHEIDYELLSSNLLKQYFQKISALSITGIINHMNDNSKLIRYLMDNQILHKNLRILNLAGNDLTSLEQLSLGSFPSMEFINIGYNRIQSLNGISSMVNLIELHAPHNRINFIQTDDLKPLKQLEQVDLTNNFFPSLDSLAALQNNTQLRLLNLQGNPLTTSAHYPKQVAKLLFHITTIDIPDVSLIPKLSNYSRYEEIAFVNPTQAAKFLVEQKSRFLMSLSPKSLKQNELENQSNCFLGVSPRNQASSIQPLPCFSPNFIQGNEVISLQKNQCFSSRSKQSTSQSPKLFPFKEQAHKDQQFHSQEQSNKLVNQQPFIPPQSSNFSQSAISSQNSYFPSTGKVLPSVSLTKDRHCIPDNLIDNYFSSDQIRSTSQSSSSSTPLSLPSPRINSVQSHNHLNSTKGSLIKQLISSMNKNSSNNVLGIYEKQHTNMQPKSGKFVETKNESKKL